MGKNQDYWNGHAKGVIKGRRDAIKEVLEILEKNPFVSYPKYTQKIFLMVKELLEEEK